MVDPPYSVRSAWGNAASTDPVRCKSGGTLFQSLHIDVTWELSWSHDGQTDSINSLVGVSSYDSDSA